MNNILLIILALYLGHHCSSVNSELTTEDRINAYGYSTENHTVTTPDGYNITIVRILGDTDTDSARPVVLMMHGLSSSSDCWIVGGPDNASAFYLADSGYDVWLGNSRGNPYARIHSNYTPDDREFWRFSINEIGLIDLPTIIDYILGVTNQANIHYVGHSQGTAILLILLSTQPEYGEKVKTSHLLAPIAFMETARSKLIAVAELIVGQHTPLDPLVGDTDFLKFVRDSFAIDKCSEPAANDEYCAAVLFEVYGGTSGYLNKSLLPEIFQTHPASCSTNQAIHLVQLHKSGKFRKYDYGLIGNQERYGSSSPPDYELDNINTGSPLQLYYSAFDELSSNLDVEKLISILGDKVEPHFIDLTLFAHIDFLWSSIVREVIFEGVLQRMNEAEGIAN